MNLSKNTKEEMMSLTMRELDLRMYEHIEKAMFRDEMIYGVSGCHVSETGMRKLSVAEVMEIYGDLLTKEEKQKLGL